MSIPKLEDSLFPKSGIKVSFLNKFIEKTCGGRDAIKHLSTADICEQFVKPATKDNSESYCQYLIRTEHPDVGQASVFISHAWKYLFVDVCDAITEYFEKDSPDTDPIIWFDIFTNNQHIAVELPFDWWANTFQSAIGQFGHTVMVFAPWNDPVPLTRSWCIWELYCTHETKSAFSIAMTRTASADFIDAICKNCEKEVNKMLATIDAERSECFKPEDRERIFDAIKSSVGFDALNKLVFANMRDWVIKETKRWLDTGKFENEKRRIQLLSALASLYSNQGSFEAAEALYINAFEQAKTNFGMKNRETLIIMYHLGNLNHLLGKYTKCVEYHEETLSILETISIDERKDMITAAEEMYILNGAALGYQYLGKYDAAEERYRRCIAINTETNGSKHPHNLVYQNNLALVYRLNGKLQQAADMHEQSVATATEILGKNHPNTLIYLNNWGYAVILQRNFDLAKKLYTECYEIRAVVLGADHHHTIDSLHNLAVLDIEIGEFERAQLRFEQCLASKEEMYTKDNINYLTTVYQMLVMYRKQAKWEIAESVGTDCYERCLRVVGATSMLTLRVMSELAFIYVHGTVQQLAKAEDLVNTALEKVKTAQGERHPTVVACEMTLSMVLSHSIDTFDASEKLILSCIAFYEETIGLQSLPAIDAKLQYGKQLLWKKKYEVAHDLPYEETSQQAMTCLNWCLEQRLVLFGPEHQDVHEVQNLLKNEIV